MHQAPSDPRLVSLSSAVYRAIITFYPQQFKREYGSSFSIMGFALATLGYVLQADAPKLGGKTAQPG